MFVIGEKVGQKVYPPGGGPGPAMGGMGNIGMGGMQPGMGNMVGGPMGGMAGGPGYSQQAHLAQQNANMEMLEARRREREMAARGGPPGAGPGPRAPPPGAGVSLFARLIYQFLNMQWCSSVHEEWRTTIPVVSIQHLRLYPPYFYLCSR